MPRLLLLASLSLVWVVTASAQPTSESPVSTPVAPKQLAPSVGISSNTVQTMASTDDALWFGPLLTVFADGPNPLRADDPRFEDNVVFALDVVGESVASTRLIAGLAFDDGTGQASAGGFLVSRNGGESLDFRPPPLDASADSTLSFGGVSFPAIPVTQPAGSAPQGVAQAGSPPGEVLWSANARAGLRRSTDDGASWQRVVLPPDTLDAISPDAPVPFIVGPPLDDGRGFANHFAFDVLVDASGTVWAGTAGGLNRSRPSDVAPNGDRGWRRFEADRPGTLPATAAVRLAEQPLPNDRSALWIATWPIGLGSEIQQRFGVAVTDDGGDTFRPYLIGEQVFDFAFRGDVVYAAGTSGLLISPDRGRSWQTLSRFRTSDDVPPLPDDVEGRSVATTRDFLWVGTTDGLLRLNRADEPRLVADDPAAPRPTWTVFRTDVPVNPDAPDDVAPDVATYAYPNPFSPTGDGQVRFRFELDAPETVRIEIYDFGMNRVRVLERQRPSGQGEIAWDGTGQSGLRLPNGVYFYTVDTGTTTARGKLILQN